MKLDLKDNLLFCNVAELRNFCEQLTLCKKGSKIALIERIIAFCSTGKVLNPESYPAESCATKKTSSNHNPDALMLFGSYKNDSQTRHFFKKLIGEHFHFTAFGIDWLKARWMQKNPPTYQEFANMWQQNYEARRNKTPKEEWMLIRFRQNFKKAFPAATNKQMFSAWKSERKRNFEIAQEAIAALKK